MYKILLCMRYLRTRYIALASIISVMLGVATMIVVNSVMAGFSTEMRSRIHGFLADVVVESRTMDGIPDSEKQLELIRKAVGPYVAAMTATVEVPAMVTYNDPVTGETFTQPIQLIGIDPAGKADVSPLKKSLASYQAGMEDGVEVRPPLRSEDEPVVFELTEHAKKHRDMVKQQEMLYLQPASATTPPSPFDLPGQATAGDASEPPVPDFDAVADVAPTEGDAAVLDSDDEAAPSLPMFTPSPMDGIAGQGESADPTAPFPAKLFVGDQITSFQARDPETGIVRKVDMVSEGDDIIITTIGSKTPPEPISFSATVVDKFRSGMSEYDSQLVMMNIYELQKNRGMLVDTDGDGKYDVDAITSVQIRLNDYEDADIVVKKLRAAFTPNAVNVSTWEAKHRVFLSAVEVETAILNVLLFLIIAVAGFGILAIFFMIVVEKTRDIGILKSLGASSNGVMSIFLSYGFGLGVVGSAAGVAIGLLFVHYINEIEDLLSAITGRKVFDEAVYYFPEIPTQVSPWMVFWVAMGSIGIAALASVLPARRASRLHPVRALRND